MKLTEGTDWKRCEDCAWMIIKDSTDRWTLFFQVAPVIESNGRIVPQYEDRRKPPDGHVCERTGKAHR